MKTLICSDIHLTASFDEEKYAYLRTLFSHYDHIILNGDFWDAYETSFAKLIQSRWKQLFALMRKKHVVYIYGNHDRAKWTLDPNIFSHEQHDQYTLHVGKRVLHIEHGHRIAPSFDLRYPRLADVLSTFFSGRRFRFVFNVHALDNILMKNYAAKHLTGNQLLICGHSHIPEHNRRRRFINTGKIDDGIASYVSITGKSIQLVTETYD